VKSLGSKLDDIQNHRHGHQSKSHNECQRVGAAFANSECNEADYNSILQNTDTANHDAAVVTALQLGANTSECIELIKKVASIISVPSVHTISKSSTKTPHFYLVLDGQLEVGSTVKSNNDKGLHSSPRILLSRLLFTRGNSWIETDLTSKDDDISIHSSCYFHLLHLANASDMVGQFICITGDISAITIQTKSTTPNLAIVIEIPKHVLDSLLNDPASTLIGCLDFVLTETSQVIHMLDWGIDGYTYRQMMSSQAKENIVVSRFL